MTTPVNLAGEGSRVGVQAGHAYIDTVTLPGGQLTVRQDATPEAKYRVGVENLKSGNPRTARELIWDAMMSNHVDSEVMFHWLVAMLSGRRTVRQLSEEEIDQLKHSRSRYIEIGDGCGSFEVSWLRCEDVGFAVSGVVDAFVLAA